MTEDAYLPAISSNTSLAGGPAPLDGIGGALLAGMEFEDEGGALFAAGFLFLFSAAALVTFSAAGRDHAAALAPGARTLAARAAGFPPYTTTLPCRLRAGVALA